MAVLSIKSCSTTRDLTPEELANVQKKFPDVKEGDYGVFILAGASCFEPKTREIRQGAEKGD